MIIVHVINYKIKHASTITTISIRYFYSCFCSSRYHSTHKIFYFFFCPFIISAANIVKIICASCLNIFKAHIIITRQNLHDLSGMLAIGTDLGLGLPASVLIPAPSSHDMAHYKAFMPSYSDVMAALGRMPEEEARQLLARGLLNNIPACVVMTASKGYEDLLQTQRPVRQDWIQDGDLSEPGARLKLRTPCPRADRCGLARICVGYHEPYVSLFGSDELRPMDFPTGAAGRRRRRRP